MKILFLGDSITDFFNWYELFYDYSKSSGQAVYNRGISGDTTDRLIERLQDNVLTIKPKNIVLLIGTNDIGRGLPLSESLKNVEQIIKSSKDSCPDVNFILEAVYPVIEGRAGKRKNSDILESNRKYKVLAEKYGVTGEESKQEMLEFVKDKGLIMSWEDINAMKVSKEDILLKGTAHASPVQLPDISKTLEKMGYKVDSIEDDFINFNDGEDRYRLYSVWAHRYQMNCIEICKTYTVDQEDVEAMSRIAVEITDSIRIAKLHVYSYDDRSMLRVSADSFYSDSTHLNSTILAIMDLINKAMSRLRDRMPQRREDDSTIEFNDVQQQIAMGQNKTKYEC